MSSLIFTYFSFFVPPQLQQLSCAAESGAGSWLASCSSVTLSIYWLITSSSPAQNGRVKHCSDMGHSLVTLPSTEWRYAASMARKISPAV